MEREQIATRPGAGAGEVSKKLAEQGHAPMLTCERKEQRRMALNLWSMSLELVVAMTRRNAYRDAQTSAFGPQGEYRACAVQVGDTLDDG